MERWYQMSVDEALGRLNSSNRGLSEDEAGKRLAEYGPNRLREKPPPSGWRVLARQFTDVMVMILLAAAGIAALTGDLTDSAMILVIVALNASLGFSQESRAERALAGLKKFEQPFAVVHRNGVPARKPASDLVPGDLIQVEAGDRVPADGRLIETAYLKVDESQLTGESVSVEKSARALGGGDLALGDRSNLVFSGTTVTTGRAHAVVTETGMATELGKVARMLQTVERRATPLQQRLAHLGRWLAAAALVMTGIIFFAGLVRGEPVELMLLTAISLAVAVIPEGLPAVVTITLALGAQRMVRREGLIRKLSAVETLGCVTTVCSDKTGTLTQNLMSAELIHLDGQLIRVEGNGYNPDGGFIRDGRRVEPGSDPGLIRLLKTAALCTDSRLQREGGQWTLLGDPTEAALLVAAAKAGMWKEDLEKEFPRIGEIPFDSSRKMMATLHRDSSGAHWSFVKGGIEEILKRSTDEMRGGGSVSLTDSRRQGIMGINRDLAADGVRVIACAAKKLESVSFPEDLSAAEDHLTFLGLFGILDPPRPEARAAVARCRTAGIRPVMITGDHAVTAQAIASSLGILSGEDRVMTGAELGSAAVEDLVRDAGRVSVYARVSPEDKLKIVEALKRRGEVVAMTGDGVNDAPALRAADIGVSMGRGGTDVAREASEMVLLDDNFATIVAAVEEGRILYDNIRKFTRYMLATNSGEILTMFFAILLGLPLPLLPVQILWMNLVTDGLPALALSVEPPERNVMRRPPRKPGESLFSEGLGWQIAWVGLLMGVSTVLLFRWVLADTDPVHARTSAFFVLTLFQMFNVMAIRSERDSLWTVGLLSNPKLLGAVVLTVLLQVLITYHPSLQRIFDTTALSAGEISACAAVASSVFFGVEAEKWFRRRLNQGR